MNPEVLTAGGSVSDVVEVVVVVGMVEVVVGAVVVVLIMVVVVVVILQSAWAWQPRQVVPGTLYA